MACHANTNTNTNTLSLSSKPDGAREVNGVLDQETAEPSPPSLEETADRVATTPPPTTAHEPSALGFTPPAEVLASCASQSWREQAQSVLDFLNEKTGRVYRPVDTNLKLIIARLKSGATVLQCRQVIARKARQWKDRPDMAPYLRPATLFNATKFEQYLGELVPKPDNPAQIAYASPAKEREAITGQTARQVRRDDGQAQS